MQKNTEIIADKVGGGVLPLKSKHRLFKRHLFASFVSTFRSVKRNVD